MNLFLRQNIVGLLRHAAECVPAVRRPALLAAEELQRRPSRPWLEAAAALFEEAVLLSGDAIYTTGAYWAARALAEADALGLRATAEPELGGVAPLTFPVSPPCLRPRETQDEIWEEAAIGMLELLERMRRGASLEQALALFASWGEECAPAE